MRIDGKKYLAHRLIWMWKEGYFPEHQIDHIDRNKSNNKWNNLRHISSSCNARNVGVRQTNKSGITGVCWAKKVGKWKSYVRLNNKLKNLGDFFDFDEAVCHRLAAEQCVNWSGCDDNSPAYQYVQKMLGES